MNVVQVISAIVIFTPTFDCFVCANRLKIEVRILFQGQPKSASNCQPVTAEVLIPLHSFIASGNIILIFNVYEHRHEECSILDLGKHTAYPTHIFIAVRLINFTSGRDGAF